MQIPVFHDDQHGTAIIVAAPHPERVDGGRQGPQADVKLVSSGAGAAALACLDLTRQPRPARKENILVTDSKGVVYEGRTEYMDPEKARYARPTQARTLADIVPWRGCVPRPFGRGRA